ncbi:MAG: hypothetical protein KDB31_02735, partial [Microthrixaceae bacterium]|nr:hypothetical protein [Microthrixaceae bacterium]
MASDTGEATGQADPAADERGAETPTAVAYHDRMNDSDALMWNIEKDPMLRSTITTIVSISGHIDRDELHTHVERLSRAVPRLRERVRGNPYSLAPPRWEVDPNFDLDYHLRFVRAPGEGSESDVLRLAEPIAMQGFDRARPLWEMTYVDDLAEGNSALVVKIHHSVTDGVGAMRLMLELFDLEEHPAPRAQPDPPEVHVLNQAQRFIDALG